MINKRFCPIIIRVLNSAKIEIDVAHLIMSYLIDNIREKKLCLTIYLIQLNFSLHLQ